MSCVWGEHRLNVLSGFLHLLFHVCRGLSLLYSALQGGGNKGWGCGAAFLISLVRRFNQFDWPGFHRSLTCAWITYQMSFFNLRVAHVPQRRANGDVIMNSCTWQADTYILTSELLCYIFMCDGNFQRLEAVELEGQTFSLCLIVRTVII